MAWRDIEMMAEYAIHRIRV